MKKKYEIGVLLKEMEEIKMTPWMDEKGLQAFSEYISEVNVFLEYGCGGSTVYAAEHGVKNIISVDSHPDWIKKVQENTKDLECQCFINYCNIGKVKQHGYPVDNSGYRKYYSYCTEIWKVAKDNNLTPELVLVDGRFRVACFLYSLISCNVGTKILFDDYVDRPRYHVVEEFCKIYETRGRMAIFMAEKKFDLPHILEAFAHYSLIPN